jgi:cellulose synthase/poly-beta-1,6-N-acetylglucosamine synthase-like glycosyltransferase
MPLALRFSPLDSSRNSYPADVITAAKLVERPWIEAVQEGRLQRFWSVMVPIYNCPPHYLRETLKSVLRQDPGPAEMQIEVIDNCSTAETNQVTRAGENVADERRSIDLFCADFLPTRRRSSAARPAGPRRGA